MPHATYTVTAQITATFEIDDPADIDARAMLDHLPHLEAAIQALDCVTDVALSDERDLSA